MQHRIRILTLILIGMISYLPEIYAQSQKVELRVESASRSGAIEVGQRFYIYVTVKNINQEPAPISSAGGAEVIYWAQSANFSSTTSINGKVTQSIERTWTATLVARKKGTYTYGPITVGGIKSNTAKYTIVEAGATHHDPNQGGGNGNSQDPTAQGGMSGMDPTQGGPTYIGKGNDQLFMRASVSKTTAYEQEALVYTVKLYSTYGSIKFIGATDAPKFDGFVIEESNAISKQLTFETYQGRQYATAVIARYIIFPQMSGKLKIIGNKYTVSTDAQEYYHDPYFTTLTVRRPIQLNVTPNDLVVDVKPLPTPRPANFSGGVGKFNLSSNIPATSLSANQAASITYTVSGEGNLKYVHLPDLNAVYPDQLEVFSPTTDVKTVVGASNVSGSVKFDYSFMPLEQGSFTIPSVEMVYFNPSTGKYETTSTRSYTVNVGRGTESSKSQATLTFNSTLMNVKAGELSGTQPMIRGFLYWLWYIIPFIILIVVVYARRKYLADRADIAGLKSRRAAKMAKKRLKKASVAMKNGDEDKFYDEILKAVWGYLSDKLRLPTSELSRENVSQILEQRNIPQEDIADLVKLLDDLEFAKYSPASLRRPMQDVFNQSEELLKMLEDSFAKAKLKSADSSDDNSGNLAIGEDDINETPAEKNTSKPISNKNVMHIIAVLILSAFSFAANGASTNQPIDAQSVSSAPMRAGVDQLSPAQEEELLNEADRLYAKGDYEAAAAKWNEVLESQGRSAPLLFNLGCAYYKMGNEGEARVALERAKKLDPSNKQINQDINYIAARVQDANKAELKGKKGDVAPDAIGFFGRVNKKISEDTSSDVWAEFAAMAFILTLIFVAIYLFVENVKLRKTGFFCSLIFIVFTLIFIILSEMAASHFRNDDEAIVTAFKVELLSDPHQSTSRIGAPLNRGTKLEILESELNSDGDIGWYKVKLNSKNIGWVPAKEITII